MKYNIYEVVESNEEGTRFRPIAIMRKKEFEEKYKGRKILSTKDYDDTKTTSIIILNENI